MQTNKPKPNAVEAKSHLCPFGGVRDSLMKQTQMKRSAHSNDVWRRRRQR